MMKILLVASVFYTSISFAAGFSDTTDRFSGVRTVEWSSSPTVGKLQPSFIVKSKPEEAPDEGVILLSGAFSEWRFLRCNKTYWLIDGAPAKAASQDHKGIPHRGSVIELIAYSFPIETLKKMGGAEKVEYKVCNSEFALSEAEKQGLHQVIQALGI